MKYLFILLLLPLHVFAQTFDNFNDGDFTNNPPWNGSINDFKINSNNQLQLFTSGEGTSFLTTAVNSSTLQEWNFLIKCSFSPSDNNQTLIYLVSDNPNPDLSTDAFCLKLGESGSSDAIELYRKDTSFHLIARGTPGFLKNPFFLRIKITRDDGTWQIFADSTGGTDYKLQATGNNDYWGIYHCFSLNCKYTSSNSSKFYFDDIYAGPALVDITPPVLLQYTVENENSVNLKFSEGLEHSSCTNIENFLLNSSVNPIASGRDANDHSRLHLLFNEPFNEEKEYKLTIKGVKDPEGNVIHDTAIQFMYHKLRAFDVLFTEIMADPDPPVDISCEYIELYNRTAFPISLEDWHLTVNGTRKSIPSATIKPVDYLLLTNAFNDSILNSNGDVVIIDGLVLDNDGAELILTDGNDAVVHFIKYDQGFYNDHYKKEGGWSIEMIDINNPCSGRLNWKASVDESGGTPGNINSVKGENRDNTTPEISYISMPDEKSVTLHFIEPMDSLSLSNPALYRIEDVGSPLEVKLHSPSFDAITLVYEDFFLKNRNYTLMCYDTITDCIGNRLPDGTRFQFAAPYDPGRNSVIINEIMYNPAEGGAEFIELYNCSDSTFQLGDLILAEVDPFDGKVLSSSVITTNRRLFMPDSYLVLTADPIAVRKTNISGGISSFIELQDFPALSNSGGTIALLNKHLELIDEMSYNEDMQFKLLTGTKGVSLERVNPFRSGNEQGNWHSASQSCGYATPGLQNSQLMKTEAGQSGKVIINPETISPDNDGYNDQLTVIYKSDSPGQLVTIRIFNSDGFLVKTLTGNHLAGNDNIFTWDGITGDGLKAPLGIYIIHTQVFDLNGNVSVYKNPIVVSGK